MVHGIEALSGPIWMIFLKVHDVDMPGCDVVQGYNGCMRSTSKGQGTSPYPTPDRLKEPWEGHFVSNNA